MHSHMGGQGVAVGVDRSLVSFGTPSLKHFLLASGMATPAASSHFLTLLSLLSRWPPSGAEPSDCSFFSLGQACCPNLSQGLHTCSFLCLGHSSPFSSLLSSCFLSWLRKSCLF